jgi:hypothetical protein
VMRIPEVLFHKIIIGGGLSLVEKVVFHWKGLEHGISAAALGVIIMNHHYLNYSPLSLSRRRSLSIFASDVDRVCDRGSFKRSKEIFQC